MRLEEYPFRLSNSNKKLTRCESIENEVTKEGPSDNAWEMKERGRDRSRSYEYRYYVEEVQISGRKDSEKKNEESR